MNVLTASAKLTTYVPLTASQLGVKCHPANGGGATVDLSSDTLDYAKHTTGYFVGGIMENIIIPARSRASVYGSALLAIHAKGAQFAGFWHNGQDVEAEASEGYAFLPTARAVAEHRGERAIYDIAAGKSIML